MTTTVSAPPARIVMQMIMAAWTSQAIQVAAALGVADTLRSGPRTCAHIAAETSCDANALYRVLRLLMSHGIFAEDTDGRICMTPLAEPLRSDVPDSLRAYAIQQCNEMNRRSMANLLHSVKTGETAFQYVFGTGIFEYLQHNPDEAALFNAAMSSRSNQENAAILAEYSFAGLSTAADIGGGHGTLLAAILQAQPTMRGILFDRPSVVESARSGFERAGLSDRCEFVPGDFFDAVPEGADAYLLKRVLHDWSDERSIDILRVCRQAIPDTGKLLIFEHVIAPGNEQSEGKTLDLLMMANNGAKERSEIEFRDLLTRGGFNLQRVVPTRAGINVLEAVPA